MCPAGLRNSKGPAWQEHRKLERVETGLGLVASMFLARVPYTREAPSKHLQIIETWWLKQMEKKKQRRKHFSEN